MSNNRDTMYMIFTMSTPLEVPILFKSTLGPIYDQISFLPFSSDMNGGSDRPTQTSLFR